MKTALHIGSITLLLITWIVASHLIGERLLPEPKAVALALLDEARYRSCFFSNSVRNFLNSSRWRSASRSGSLLIQATFSHPSVTA